MSSAERLREFVSERLTAAAEEIFRVFKQTIVEYEEEIDRQCRLLDIAWRPEIKLHRIELPQQHVCKEEEKGLTEQQLCNQERNSSLDPEQPEPPQIKEEQEELCTSQEGEQLELKLETDTYMLVPINEEIDHSEPEPESDYQPLSNSSHEPVSEGQKGCEHEDSGITTDTTKPKKRDHKSISHSNNVYNTNIPEIHPNTHTGKKSIKCDTCGKTFNYKSKLYVHMRSHTGEKPYSCKTCGKGYRYSKDLKVHMRTRTGEKPFFCGTCGKRFCQMSDLRAHLRIHTELPQQHVCKEEEDLTEQKLCNQERNSGLGPEEPKPSRIKGEQEELCSSKEGEQLELKTETEIFMLSHSNYTDVAQSQDQIRGEHEDSGSAGDSEPKPKKRDHKSISQSNNAYISKVSEIRQNTRTGKKLIKCDTCGKTFNYKSKLYTHLRSHTGEKPYSCDTCGKSFCQLSGLKVHIRIHTGEKPYSCETCGKGFRCCGDLKAHIRIHTGEKPYSCETCGKNFRFGSQMKIHMRSHTGERPYSCKTCGKDFQFYTGLKIHMRSHTGEKPYSCKICGKRFTVGYALSAHVRIHTGEKPYSCKTCGKDFRLGRELKTHMRIHTGERPYPCKTCGRAFTNARQLTVHMRRAHTGQKLCKTNFGKRYNS